MHLPRKQLQIEKWNGRPPNGFLGLNCLIPYATQTYTTGCPDKVPLRDQAL